MTKGASRNKSPTGGTARQSQDLGLPTRRRFVCRERKYLRDFEMSLTFPIRPRRSRDNRSGTQGRGSTGVRAQSHTCPAKPAFLSQGQEVRLPPTGIPAGRNLMGWVMVMATECRNQEQQDRGLIPVGHTPLGVSFGSRSHLHGCPRYMVSRAVTRPVHSVGSSRGFLVPLIGGSAEWTKKPQG